MLDLARKSCGKGVDRGGKVGRGAVGKQKGKGKLQVRIQREEERRPFEIRPKYVVSRIEYSIVFNSYSLLFSMPFWAMNDLGRYPFFFSSICFMYA